MTRLNLLDISFIVPKEATNLITNPSSEIDTTGWTPFGAGVSVARVTTQSRRGIASNEITTAANVESGEYYAISMTTGVQYSWSRDILDVSGQTFNLYIANASNTLKSTNTTWTGTGYWKRRSVTWTADATATFRLFVTRSSVNSTTKFYTDGAQCEVGAVSTYLDGDMIGTVIGQTDYRWNRTPHASTSWRSGQTKTGGTFVKLSSYAKLLHVVGLGMEPLSNIAIPSTLGGSFYQNTISLERPFTLICNLNSGVVGGDYALIEASRSALINAIRPDSTIKKQPMYLQIDQLDSTGLEKAETLMMPCFYDGGLEMDGTGDAYNEKIPIKFRAYNPYAVQQGETGVALGYQQSVANANYILKRGADGTWAALSSGTGGVIAAMAATPDGYLYIGGGFTDLGDSNGDYISKWTGSAFSSLGTGMSGGSVYALAVDASGNLYAGGAFTSAGGVSNTLYIAKWDGTWHALSTGAPYFVRVLAVGPDGCLYVGGDFINIGGDPNGDYIVKWTGSAWVSLGTGMNGSVYALAFDKAGNLYAGGAFTSAGGVSNTAYIAKWDGTVWSALGTGMNASVTNLICSSDNSIYAGGNFTLASSVLNTSHIAKWNGTNWLPLATGAISGSVYGMAFDKNNNLYVSGNFITIGGIAPPDSVAMWNGFAWLPIDARLPGSLGTTILYPVIFSWDGVLYLGTGSTGTAYSATVTIPNNGSAACYPKIMFIGPGTCYQIKNYTTGQAIYFNLTLLAGETAVLNTDPLHTSFISSFRGSIMNNILPGSNLNFQLLPGVNNISCFVYGSTTAATAVSLIWKNTYHSIDGAVR